MAKLTDCYPGSLHGKLTVLGVTTREVIYPAGPRRERFAICACECGSSPIEVKVCVLGSLQVGCGCVRLQKLREAIRTHGESGSRTWGAWQAMKQRCLNPKTDFYCDYGGRGITVDPLFLGPSGYKNFKAELGEPPDDSYTIDRKDVNGNYSPGNIKWSSQTEQARNKRNTLWFTYQTKKVSFPELCEKLNLKYQLVYDRLYVLGWSPEKAFNCAGVKEYNEQS